MRTTLKILSAVLLAVSAGSAGIATPALAAGQITIGYAPTNAQDAQALKTGLAVYSLINGMSQGANIQQNGAANLAGILQNGSGNHGVLVQQGSGHTGTIEQNGNNNSCGLFQFGKNTSGSCVQNGDDGAAAAVQIGF